MVKIKNELLGEGQRETAKKEMLKGQNTKQIRKENSWKRQNAVCDRRKQELQERKGNNKITAPCDTCSREMAEEAKE